MKTLSISAASLGRRGSRPASSFFIPKPFPSRSSVSREGLCNDDGNSAFDAEESGHRALVQPTKDKTMSKQLVEHINTYRELHTSMDWDNWSADEAEELANTAWTLIQQLAREVVLRGEREVRS